MIKKTSIIWVIEKEKIQELLDNSYSFSEVMKKLGYTNIEGNLRTLKKRIEQEKLDVRKLNENRLSISKNKILNKKPLISLDELLVENSGYSRQQLKERIISEKLLKYVCRDCGNEGIWNDKPLVLHLEHINGINNDNRLNNLCFLCPSCHSQTKTYCGKNNKINEENKNCKICGAKVSIHNTSGLCFSCAGEKRCKVKITKEELEKHLKIKPVSEIAKIYNITDNAIRKKAKKLGLNYLLKPRGYWTHGDLV